MKLIYYLLQVKLVFACIIDIFILNSKQFDPTHIPKDPTYLWTQWFPKREAESQNIVRNSHLC